MTIKNEAEREDLRALLKFLDIMVMKSAEQGV